MELNAEQAINELETQTKYAKFIGSEGVLLSAKCASFVLEHARYYEQRIAELTEQRDGCELTIHECECDIKRLSEENERLTARVFEENHLRHQAEEMLANGMSVVKSDTVRKMQERLTKEFDRMHKNNFMTPEVRQWIIDQTAKEMVGTVNDNLCVACGEIIPEGRQVCPNCENPEPLEA